MYPILFRLPDWFPVLGGEPITSFGVMMFFSFLAGGFVLRAQMVEADMDGDAAWDLLFMAVVGGIVGAKLYYVLLNFDRTVQNPLGMILSRGGMVWYGGFLLATAMVVWKIRGLKLPLGRVADFCAPSCAIAYAVGRVGCFLVGDDYGRPTSAFYGIRFPQGTPPTRVDVLESQFGVTVDPELIEKYGQVVPVHPTQLYEIAISTLFFLLLWRIRKHDHQRGWLFMLWLGMAGMERFLVEFFRAKDDRFLGPFTLAQFISVGLIVVALSSLAKLGGEGGGPQVQAA